MVEQSKLGEDGEEAETPWTVVGLVKIEYHGNVGFDVDQLSTTGGMSRFEEDEDPPKEEDPSEEAMRDEERSKRVQRKKRIGVTKLIP